MRVAANRVALAAMDRRFPLHIHILTLFLIVVLLVGGVTAWVGYKLSCDALEASATALTEKISQNIVNEIRGVIAPAGLAAGLLGHDVVGDATNLPSRWRRLGAIRHALTSSDNFSSVFVGYESGDFLFVRQIQNDAQRHSLGAPPGTRFMVQSVEQGQGRERGVYVYLDPAFAVLRADEHPEYPTSFDPRTRPWYTSGMASEGLVTTAPYLFFLDRKVGVTVAQRMANGKGVVGVDILLDTIEANLARQKVTPSSHLALVNTSGLVLAHEDAARETTVDAAPDSPPHLKQLDDLGVPALHGLRPVLEQLDGSKAHNSRISIAGENWRLSIHPIVIDGSQPIFLAMAIPDRELFATALRLRSTSITLTLLILLVAVPITWGISRAISGSLRRLAEEAESIRRFEFSAPIQLRSVVKEVDELSITMGGMKGAIRRFLDLTQAVAAEEDFEHLLPLLLRETLSASDGQAGVLYLADKDELVPTVALSGDGADLSEGLRAIPIKGDASLIQQAIRQQITLTGALFPEQAEEADKAGKVGEADEATGIGDLIRQTAAPFSVVVPLINRQRQVLGALLLQRKTPIGATRLAFVNALSNSSSISLETRELIGAQKELFAAFIQMLAGSIDAKSHSTGGHCTRVPELTKMLAQAACQETTGPFKAFQLDAAGWESVHVAAWLHDCGKVTTPEYVIEKATKLETLYDRIHEVRMRFEVLKRDAEIACLKAIAAGEDEHTAQTRLREALKQLDDDFTFVASCNEGGESMTVAAVERLQAIAAQTWNRTLDDRLGVSHEELERKARMPASPLPVVEPLLADKPEHLFARRPQDRIPPDNPWRFRVDIPEWLYNRGELHNLAIGQGTLSPEERYKINEHIIQTIIMLSQLPFPKHLRQVPEIAGSHHEKMNGTGFPRRLKAADMSVAARMVAVADIFEALTAADRPYKKGKTLSEAIDIMARMKDNQHIDPDLFALFLRAGVYRDYAAQYMRPEQIDAVDIEAYLHPEVA